MEFSNNQEIIDSTNEASSDTTLPLFDLQSPVVKYTKLNGESSFNEISPATIKNIKNMSVRKGSTEVAERTSLTQVQEGCVKKLEESENAQQSNIDKPEDTEQGANIEKPAVFRKMSAMVSREAIRNKCKNSLFINRPSLNLKSLVQSNLGESGETAFRTCVSQKSYSLKSSNYSHSQNGEDENDRELNEDMSPVNIEDVDIPELKEYKKSLTVMKQPMNKKSCMFNFTQTDVNKSKYASPMLNTTPSPIEKAFEDLYTTEDYLGEGCSSVVRICQSVADPHTKYAVKIMRVPDREYFDIALKEFKMVEELDQENVMKVYDIFYNTMHEKVYMLMEYAGEGSNLMTLIKDSDKDDSPNLLTEEVIAGIMKQLLNGLQYLHSKGVCHRDIKPSNLYVTKDLKQLKILDFNVALRFSIQQKMFGVTGEELYSAPELGSGRQYDERVDLWSAGICLYQMLTLGRKIKIFAYDEEEEIQALVDKKVTKVKVQNQALKSLLSALLTVNPDKRLTAQQALQMDWLSILDQAQA